LPLRFGLRGGVGGERGHEGKEGIHCVLQKQG
jgi:hypothetical protein